MTNEPKAGHGLDAEILAAYIDKRLPPDERAAVEAKLAADPDSYELLVELIHANEALKDQLPQDEELPEPGERPKERTDPQAGVVPLVPRAPKMTRWAIAGGVLAVAAALAMIVWVQPEVWQRIRGGEPVDPLMAKLVDAVGEERYIEARLTGGFKYGPLRSVTRGPNASTPQNIAIAALAAQLQESAVATPSLETLHASGVARLLTGDSDGAIQLLGRAATLPGAGAAVLSDLAAAYASRAATGGLDADWGRAFDAASRAVELAPTPLSEALFNRALASSRLDPSSSARYWSEYLAVESSSEWRELATTYLDRTPRSGRN